MRARGHDGRARGDDRPPAARAAHRSGGGDVARAEGERRVLAVQEVAAQVVADPSAGFGRELARRDDALQCAVERGLESRHAALAGLREELLEARRHAVEEILLAMALGAREAPAIFVPGILQPVAGTRALAPEVRADRAARALALGLPIVIARGRDGVIPHGNGSSRLRLSDSPRRRTGRV